MVAIVPIKGYVDTDRAIRPEVVKASCDSLLAALEQFERPPVDARIKASPFKTGNVATTFLPAYRGGGCTSPAAACSMTGEVAA